MTHVEAFGVRYVFYVLKVSRERVTQAVKGNLQVF